MQQLKYLWMDLTLYALRCKKSGCVWPLLMIIIYPQTWANIQYRLQKAVVDGCRIPLVRQLLLICFFFNGRIVKMLTGIEVHHSAECGPGLYFAHLGSIIIAMNCKVGHSCSIHQEVTLGGAGYDNEANGFPALGNAVYVGAGAKICGGVKVGSDVLIGANAVVVKDIPSHSTAVGVPAKVINSNGSSKALMVYPGLEI